MRLEFFIVGNPAPGGSKSAFALRRRDGSIVTRAGGAPVINVTDAGGNANKLWKKAAAIQARAFMQGQPPLAGPLEVRFVFFLRRPQRHYRTGRHSDILRDDAPAWHVTKPDALKFARSTEDALTGVIWVDDAQNVGLTTEKRYATDRVGCQVYVVILDDPALAQRRSGEATMSR